jgi:hypothetical protein
MKRVIISLTFLFLSLFSFSQSTFYAYSLRSGNWNAYTKKWDLEDSKVSIKIEFSTTNIRVYDKAESRYNVYSEAREESSKDWKSTKWDAYDEKNRRVVVSIVKYENGTLAYTVMYDDYLLIYYMEKSNMGLSPLR